ncbi:hypothetical protein EMIT0P12_30358 [Pseudomonas sp. IT-P12]|jgi:hypothetical protein
MRPPVRPYLLTSPRAHRSSVFNPAEPDLTQLLVSERMNIPPQNNFS